MSRRALFPLVLFAAMLLNALSLVQHCIKVAPTRHLMGGGRGLSRIALASTKSGSAAMGDEEKKAVSRSRIASLINKKTSTGTTYKTSTGKPSPPIKRPARATSTAAADSPSPILKRVSRANAAASVEATEAPPKSRAPRAATEAPPKSRAPRAATEAPPKSRAPRAATEAPKRSVPEASTKTEGNEANFDWARAPPTVNVETPEKPMIYDWARTSTVNVETPEKPRRAVKAPEKEEEEVDEDVAAEHEEDVRQLSHISSALFQDLAISANTKKAIATVMKYQNMSTVQEQAIPAVLEGSDVFVKARTGTGKTLAFLIPAIDVLIAERKRYELASRSYQRSDGGRPPVKPLVVILSPTRELALQIAAEAQALCTFHSFQIVTLVGGVDIDRDRRAMARKDGYDIVVATPGRIFDHLTTDGPNAQLAKAVKGVKVLVLDEADRMLDMGFRIAVQKICEFFPDPRERQTLLFSATFNDDIKAIAQKTLRSGYKVIDTVGDAQEQTHSHVPQKMVISPVKSQIRDLFTVLSEHKNKGGKVIVFFPTAKQTHYFATLFDKLGVRTLEIHSGKSQSYRSRVSEEFRQAKKGFLFTSDVTARGLDYPDVTLVVQFGMTDKQNYIHRLGRTARAGKGGQGVLMCTPYEQAAMTQVLAGLPIVASDLSDIAAAANDVEAVDKKISAAQAVLGEEADGAWAAWVGYYNSQLKNLRWTGSDFAARARDLAVLQLGLPAMPRLQARTLQKMGLAKVPGFESSPNSPRNPARGRGGDQKKKNFYESSRRNNL